MTVAIRRADWESPSELILMESGSSFGRLLRSFRRSVGLSQNALAKRAGIDAGYVCRLEQGAPPWRHPSRSVVTTLANVMELSDYDRAHLMTLAGHWPWNLSPEDTRLLLEIGGKIAQAAESRQEATA